MLYINSINKYSNYFLKKTFFISFLQNYMIYNFKLTKKKNNEMLLEVNNFKVKFFNKSYYFYKELKINSFVLGLFFLFILKYDFFSFLSNLKRAYLQLFKVYYCRLKLRGLGYSLRRYNRFFFSFFMAVSNFFYFHVPTSIFVKKRKKYLVMVSYNKIQLNLLF